MQILKGGSLLPHSKFKRHQLLRSASFETFSMPALQVMPAIR
jgi:hypothetical protein